MVKNGVLDYLIEAPLNENCSITDFVLNITDSTLIKENDGNLYLMSAGKVDDN